MGRPMDCFQGTRKMESVVLFNGKYFEWNIFYFTISISALLFIKKRRELSCTSNMCWYFALTWRPLMKAKSNWHFISEYSNSPDFFRVFQLFVFMENVSIFTLFQLVLIFFVQNVLWGILVDLVTYWSHNLIDCLWNAEPHLSST